MCAVNVKIVGLVLLADHTNGRAYATALHPSVVCQSISLSSVTLCIIAKRCVLEQKLQFTAYEGVMAYIRN